MSGDLAKGSKDVLKKWNRKGKPTLKKLDKKINKVYKNIAQEVKVHDNAYQIQPDRDGSASNIYCLSAIAQGDTDVTRDGNKIKYKSLQLKGQLYQNIGGVQSSTVRLIIFIDRNFENGVPPTCANILDGSVFGTTQAPYAMRNRLERERFKVIYDKLFTLNQTGANTLPFNIYRRIGNIGTYSDSTNSGYGKNMIYMAWISGQESDKKPTVNLVKRLAFTDS